MKRASGSVAHALELASGKVDAREPVAVGQPPRARRGSSAAQLDDDAAPRDERSEALEPVGPWIALDRGRPGQMAIDDRIEAGRHDAGTWINRHLARMTQRSARAPQPGNGIALD